ncbi:MULTISPECIES: MFS transporter [Burkholderia]|jgi:predicted MFS family arabinose efflux permease|uniref:MFS transporter n=1 Tax=Burkholderia contaminans TaxID=488447 RepID=A0A286P5J0_9BURK|nr:MULTISPECIES: MFS transporter [Burkholderia]UTP26458.1 MFS transporter [Burkholderia sp. FXe9]MBA9832884.1 MFS transporter [Burkholderia contaminans]MBA9841772.1 MFS transporter [Burkholderia contaminans]MBA9867960.1 MFS transporter [Burkholderia contaminans]MBA9910633.1 MFS transporter [Burkholderia contaminans]
METNLSPTTPAPADRSISTDTTRLGAFGTVALMLAHCAGMVDLVALPVWVGTLIGAYRLDPQKAGLLATLFLAGAVLSSVFFSPRLNRLPARAMSTVGFGIAAGAFVGITSVPVDRYLMLATLHAVAGVAVGCGLSFTHGTVGRSRNPHRLFAISGLALGIFAIAFLGTVPGLIATHGGPMLFHVFASVMGVAAIACALAFPSLQARGSAATGGEPRFERVVWFGMAGVGCMALTQSMLFSFVQRIGLDRGFGLSAVIATLIALGIVNLFPAPVAGLLETRVPGRKVVQAGPVVQAALALVITQSAAFVPYAAATSVFAAVMIFTHTFAFGMLARIDRTGRAVAATPAMLMTGAAIGPVLGGTLVKQSGYGSLGFAAVLIATAAAVCFSRLDRGSPSQGV